MNDSDPRSRPGSRGVAAAAAAIAAVAAAAYANSFRVPFLGDDFPSIPWNESIRRLGALSDVLFGATTATVVGRPLLNLSFALDRAAWGLDVVGYHAVNLVVHVLAGLALFGVVRRTLLAPRCPESLRGAETGVALAIAAIWTVHPLQTESVTYVCQRAESMAGLLVLAALWCAIRGADSPRPRVWTLASVAASFAAVGTKEVAVAAPVLVLLHDRTFVSGTFRAALRRRPGLYAGLASSWVLLAALMASSAGRAGTAGIGRGVGVLAYAATQPRAIAQYLRLAFWPSPLVFDRGAALATSAGEIVPYALLVAALLAATAVLLRTRPALGFLGAWFFVILAPTSSVVPLVTQTVSEHRMYLPLAAVVAAAVLAARAALCGRERVARALAVCAVAALAWGTHARNRTYRDAMTLWGQTAERAPENARAQFIYGNELLDAGQSEAAIRRFERAIELEPGNMMAHLFRGDALHALGRDAESERAFTEMLHQVPDYSAFAYDKRGVARESLGKSDEALADYDAAIAIYPGFAEAHANRARLRRARGDLVGARDDEDVCRRLAATPSTAPAQRRPLEPRR